MTDHDRPAFFELLKGVFAYHRQALSPALVEIYWRGCVRWDFGQVTTAVDALTADPEAGKFLPKIGDITRALEGTHADRSQLAWGKTLAAMQAVGAGTDVIFDDAAIHAVIEDFGGWPKLCRTETKDLGYVQHRFCESHRAYTGRGQFEYQRKLLGERSPDSAYEARGIKPPAPAIVGEPAKCALVFEGGDAAGKTKISYKSLGALAALMPHRESAQDALMIEDRSQA